MLHKNRTCYSLYHYLTSLNECEASNKSQNRFILYSGGSCDIGNSTFLNDYFEKVLKVIYMALKGKLLILFNQRSICFNCNLAKNLCSSHGHRYNDKIKTADIFSNSKLATIFTNTRLFSWPEFKKDFTLTGSYKISFYLNWFRIFGLWLNIDSKNLL